MSPLTSIPMPYLPERVYLVSSTLHDARIDRGKHAQVLIAPIALLATGGGAAHDFLANNYNHHTTTKKSTHPNLKANKNEKNEE
ncbi:hypothetical protein OPQ81_001228 [Rhizoctonia solani]|nr:hypothetical protein OPQ81_001228 [Rhizoctonia solani]